ncbi:MAG: rhodanese-like domain-containing protein [Candidatus Odinarchaeota archaeon]
MNYYLRNMLRYWKETLTIILQFVFRRTEGWSEITALELLDRLNSSNPPLVIDIRSDRDFDKGHVSIAKRIPIPELESNLEDLQSFKSKDIVTICPGGGLSLVAADILAEAGFKHARSLRGGMDEWYQSGYPTITS